MAHKIKIWRLLGIGAALFSIIAVSVAVYYYSHPAQSMKQSPVITGRALEISTASKNELQRYMEKEDIIISVSAVSVSLMRNELKIIFFQSKNDELNKLWEEYASRTGTMSRAFSTVPDTNVHIANIINGDLNCIAFKTSAAYELAEKLSPWVCSMAIPPGLHGSGDFVGFVNFHLLREPTEAEKTKLAVDVAEISNSIYKRDIQEDGSKR